MSKLYTLKVEGKNYTNEITLAFPDRASRGAVLGVLADASGFTTTEFGQPMMEPLSFSTGEQDTDTLKCNACGNFFKKDELVAKGEKVTVYKVESWSRTNPPLHSKVTICKACMTKATQSLQDQRRDNPEIYTDLAATGEAKDSAILAAVDEQISKYGKKEEEK